ncbi:hypothetical protein [Hafnia alvei]|uniref:hypothetical protein n=1 Tax=Hafnia alvei TaxID=569 RepID=UPI0014135E27|nr:hypothetical protein [Hafnia alvei]QIP54959.1 hypothetical protein HBA19_04685 [Hafnia alvei]
MSILTTNKRTPQFRCKPVPGGRKPIAFPYAAKLQGEWTDINHSFVEWAVGEQQAGRGMA